MNNQADTAEECTQTGFFQLTPPVNSRSKINMEQATMKSVHGSASGIGRN
jgi:hypothetical protein